MPAPELDATGKQELLYDPGAIPVPIVYGRGNPSVPHHMPGCNSQHPTAFISISYVIHEALLISCLPLMLVTPFYGVKGGILVDVFTQDAKPYEYFEGLLEDQTHLTDLVVPFVHASLIGA